jgi:hypothetical protein
MGRSERLGGLESRLYTKMQCAGKQEMETECDGLMLSRAIVVR